MEGRNECGKLAHHRNVSDGRIALIVLVSVCLLALALAIGLAWHSHESSLASPVIYSGSKRM